MTQHHRRLGTGILLVALVLLPGAARAQEPYTFTVGLLGGLGGSFDADPGNDLGNTGYQLNLSMVTEPRTHVGVRLGNLALDREDRFGSLTDADLSYVTVAGEYRFPEAYYESGIFAGLGGYRLEGTSGGIGGIGGKDRSDTSIGLTVGVTGEFRITRWLAVLVELSGHYADFEEAQLFAMGHGGIAVHF